MKVANDYAYQKFGQQKKLCFSSERQQKAKDQKLKTKLD